MQLETLEIVQSLDILFYIVIFFTGLSLGSFLNSWIWRARDNTRVISGRSICIHCRRQLLWYENIPLLSYVFLGGRCRTCHEKIPLFYFFIELSTAIALLLISSYHINSLAPASLYSEWHILRDVFFLSILVIIFVYDYLYWEVIIGLTFFSLVVGFLINYFPLHHSLSSLLIGLLVGTGFFLLQYLLSRGRWIGGGDIWLGAMIGVWLGWPQILAALLLAYLLGAATAIFLIIIKKKRMGSVLPLGVFLAVATFITLRYGEGMIQWYLNLLK